MVRVYYACRMLWWKVWSTALRSFEGRKSPEILSLPLARVLQLFKQRNQVSQIWWKVLCHHPVKTVLVSNVTQVLQAEFKKKNRNTAVVNNLMDRSFAIRRSEILEKGYDLPSLFTRFPFLQESEQVCIFNKCVINLWSICGYSMYFCVLCMCVVLVHVWWKKWTCTQVTVDSAEGYTLQCFHCLLYSYTFSIAGGRDGETTWRQPIEGVICSYRPGRPLHQRFTLRLTLSLDTIVVCVQSLRIQLKMIKVTCTCTCTQCCNSLHPSSTAPFNFTDNILLDWCYCHIFCQMYGQKWTWKISFSSPR